MLLTPPTIRGNRYCSASRSIASNLADESAPVSSRPPFGSAANALIMRSVSTGSRTGVLMIVIANRCCIDGDSKCTGGDQKRCIKDVCDPGDARYGLLEQVQPNAASDVKMFADPVILPAGRAMLATILSSAGLPPPTKTIGMICMRR
jgi:hypothetical protein